MSDDESRAFLSALTEPEAAEPEGERYETLGLIGAGGMGQVHAVHDRQLGRDVARKQAHPEVPGAGAALLREAALAAVLEHPGILPVYDCGTDADGAAWYTMPLVRGQSLRARIAELGPGALHLRTLLAATEAVAFAHARQVVHCDLKSEHVMVGAHGEVQVADWGLATADGRPRGGTPRFMAPEQRRGEAPTPATDVWGLGLVLLEVLGGPHGVDAAARARMETTPASRAFSVVAPPALVAVLDRCLALRPEDRYPDAGALAGELRRYLDGQLVDAHAYSLRELFGLWYRRHRLPFWVGASALLVTLAVAALAWQRTARESAAARAAEGVADSARLDAQQQLARALVLAARNAARAHARPEAETLAAAALREEDSADARGVLMAFAAAPAPRRVGTGPRCRDRRLDPRSARWLCLDEGVRWFTGTAVAGAVEATAVDAAFLGSAVLFTGPKGDGTIVELGRRRGIGPLTYPETLVSGPDGVWVYRADILERVDPTGRTQRWRPCRETTITSAAVLDRGLLLVCGDATFRRFLPETGQTEPFAAPVLPEVGAFWAAAAHPSGAVAVGSTRGAVVVWPAAGEAFWRALPSPVLEVVWTRGGRRLLLRLKRGGLLVLDSASGATVARLPAGLGPPIPLEGERVLVGGEIWELAGTQPVEIPGPSGLSAVLPWGGSLYAARGDGALARIDPGTGKSTVAMIAQGRPLKDLTIHRDRVIVVSASEGIWSVAPDLSDRQRVDSLNGRRIAQSRGRLVVATYGRGITTLGQDSVEKAAGTWLDLSAGPAGQLVGVSADGQVWRVDGAVTAIGRVDGPQAVAAGPGALVWVAHAGGLTRLDERLDVEFDGPVLDLAVSPDGRWLAVAAADERIHVLDGEGQLRARLEGHQERVAGLAFGDGVLWSAGWDGAVRAWGLGPLTGEPAALLRAVEARWGLSADAALTASTW